MVIGTLDLAFQTLVDSEFLRGGIEDLDDKSWICREECGVYDTLSFCISCVTWIIELRSYRFENVGQSESSSLHLRVALQAIGNGAKFNFAIRTVHKPWIVRLSRRHLQSTAG